MIASFSGRPRWSRWVPTLPLAVAIACCSAPPRQPPGTPATPQSVTRDQPGGDAHDPHREALTRQLTQPWRFRPDRDKQLLVPMADATNWKRVRYWLLDHFTGFRYGKDFHGINVVFVQDVPKGQADDADSCMQQLEAWAQPHVEAFDVTMGPVSESRSAWRGTSVPVRTADAAVDFGLGRRKFSAAWAAYPAYPDACMVFAFAVPWRKHPQLAKQVLEHWMVEAVPRLKPLTETRPYRKKR